jgi:uncharacterized protein involved in exopolysaccharide biosynthesis
MNIFSIAGSLWRHKWATIPVIVLTVIAMGYVVVGRPSTYASKANVLLENAPLVTQTVNKNGTLPTGYNPLASLENLVQVADVLSQVAAAPAEEAKLVNEGAAPGYSVSPDNSLETPPILDIVGVGNSPQQAINSTQLVATDIQQQLLQLQEAQGVNKTFLITSIEYVKPTSAAKSASSHLRSAIVVLVAGLLVLLVAISVSQSIEERRRTPKRKPGGDGPVAEGGREPQAGSSSAADGRPVPAELNGSLAEVPPS